MHGADSAGRVHEEPVHPYRGPFQRDRDRLVHSSAFRRLSGKTQVFTRINDYHRTRLTHTQEVASIARTVGRALALNEDLIEALAYLHDLGHPPFGHAGEETLHELLAPWGGFSHNQFALTLVEEIEQRQPEFPGLNLSLEVLQSQRSRCPSARREESREAALLEAQVVEAADSIAYNAHDVDDAVKLGLVELAELERIPLASESLARVREGRAAIPVRLLRKLLVRELIDRQVSDVVAACQAALAGAAFADAGSARRANFLIAPSTKMRDQKTELESFLHYHVYRHAKVVAVRASAQAQLARMFEGYLRHPQWLSERFRARAEHYGLARGVGDFLASMTDRFCQEQYEKRFA
jgi:dGTPase